jgi:predicted DNA-binding protein (MmcQ/YjbR family)
MAQAAKTEKNEDKILAKLREICLALPGVQEVKTWGHPTFQAGKKSFAVLDEYHGQLCICLKMTLPLQQLLLEDRRFFKTPYSGNKGWVSLIADERIKWKEVRDLVRESYDLVAKRNSRSD